MSSQRLPACYYLMGTARDIPADGAPLVAREPRDPSRPGNPGRRGERSALLARGKWLCQGAYVKVPAQPATDTQPARAAATVYVPPKPHRSTKPKRQPGGRMQGR